MSLPIEDIRLAALRKLANDHYGGVTQAEDIILWLSASSIDYNTLKTTTALEVDATFLRWLATDPDAVPHIDPLGIRAIKATISGPLDLDFCNLAFPLRFFFCTFQNELLFRNATLPALYFFYCTSRAAIFADHLTTTGTVFLQNLEANGEIHLLNAQISGDLDCTGATLKETGYALSADGRKLAACSFSETVSLQLAASPFLMPKLVVISIALAQR